VDDVDFVGHEAEAFTKIAHADDESVPRLGVEDQPDGVLAVADTQRMDLEALAKRLVSIAARAQRRDNLVLVVVLLYQPVDRVVRYRVDPGDEVVHAVRVDRNAEPGATSVVLNNDIPWPLAVVLCLLLGAAIGAWQGYWIAYIGIPSFIVTLAGMLAFRGATQYLLEGQSVAPFPRTFQQIGSGFLPEIGQNALPLADRDPGRARDGRGG
jgi:hypothetical protein